MKRDEIWLVELGLAEKSRPVVILSVNYLDHERAVVTYVPRTTSVRETRFEVVHVDRRFKPGVFDAQGIGTVPSLKLTRYLALADPEILRKVEDTVRQWLNL